MAQMKQKDQRIKLMNEILNGIKVSNGKLDHILHFVCTQNSIVWK